ncbi:MAG: pitrilysin family protein [Myxococcota bacterium]|jgi:zinc protease|nr:pitrilysin family protein [Myxococcota bacterium]
MVKSPPLPHLPVVQIEVLANGMKIHLVEDHTSPIFTFQIWFAVGSTGERPGAGGRSGTTGVSHFLEHLLFKGTERFPDAFSTVYTRGGQLNAWTWYDATCFWEKLPAGNLELAFQLEADRLANVRFDPLTLEPEREVVRNERLLRSVNDPQGALDELLHQRAFTISPYRWPVIGLPQDLITLTPEEVQAHFRQHYNPGNAFLVIVGDFDPAEALRLAQREFGDLPAASPPALELPAEPPQVAARRDHVEKAISSGLLQVAYHAPQASTRDFLVLEVLHSLLARGKSSRLQRSLVYGADSLASSVSATLWTMRGPYLYQLEIHVAPNRTCRAVAERLEEVLAELRQTLVPEAELRKAVHALQAESVRSALETQGKANLIGFSLLATGDPQLFFAHLQQMATVTPEELREVACRYLRPEQATLVCAIHPGRLDELNERLLEDPPETPTTSARSLLRQALSIARERHELGIEVAALREEEQAIRLLEQRLDHAAANLPATPEGEAARRALHEFRTTAGKGVDLRRAAVEKAREPLARRQGELDERAQLLLAALTAAGPDDPRLLLAQAALGAAPLPPPAALAPGRSLEEELLLLVNLARLARRRQLHGEAAAALDLAHRLEATLLAGEAAPPLSPEAHALAALAWELRVL